MFRDGVRGIGAWGDMQHGEDDPVGGGCAEGRALERGNVGASGQTVRGHKRIENRSLEF